MIVPLRAGAAMLAVIALVAPATWAIAPAAADPIAEKKAEAERLAAQLETQTARVSVLTEDLNAARVDSERLEAELTRAQGAVASAQERVAAIDARVKRQAVDAYVRGGELRAVDVLMADTDELSRFPVRVAYVRTATSAAAETLDIRREERARLGEEQARLADARAAAAGALAAVSRRHREARDAVASQEATLARVQGELGELVAAEQRRRAEEEARRVQAELEARRRETAAREAAAREAARREAARRQTAPTSSPSGGNVTPDAGAGPATSGAEAAVEEAKRQLGKPYEYGADGPDSFDCSGLTQWAWKAGGKALPHSSRAQYSATSRVALPNIKLGDLLFFGPSVSGIHHVGIYAGDGRMIEASQTGTPVRYASIYRRDMVGIGRVN